jgi:protein-ribulosamine 3-kinase
LPKGYTFVKATSFGASLWTRTAKLHTLHDDGSEQNFFTKVATGDAGKTMLHGEYEGMLAIHQTIPSFCPKPIAWGQYRDAPSTYFFICKFIEMEEGHLPDVADFCSKLA